MCFPCYKWWVISEVAEFSAFLTRMIMPPGRQQTRWSIQNALLAFGGMWGDASRSKIYMICISAALCMEMQCWSNVEGVHTLILLPCGRVSGKKARRKNYSTLLFIAEILFLVSFVLSVSYLQFCCLFYLLWQDLTLGPQSQHILHEDCIILMFLLAVFCLF